MKKVIGLIVIMGLAASVAFADSVRTWNGDDGAPVFRVQNNGTEAVTITSDCDTDNNAMYVTNGTVGYTLSANTYTTVGTMVSAIEACTNSAGQYPLKLDAMCSLAADALTGKVVSATVSIPAAKHTWVDGPKWDSSGTTHFDTYYPGSTLGGVGNAKVVTHLFGNVAGTGNITLVGYADRTEVYHKVIVSPIYVSAASSSSTNYTTAADNVSPGVFDLNIDLPVARTESVLFRATRSTTATDSGGMGMILDLSK